MNNIYIQYITILPDYTHLLSIICFLRKVYGSRKEEIVKKLKKLSLKHILTSLSLILFYNECLHYNVTHYY